jgi:hypothetical protein
MPDREYFDWFDRLLPVAVVLAMIVGFLFEILIVGAGVYVAFHFVAKYW